MSRRFPGSQLLIPLIFSKARWNSNVCKIVSQRRCASDFLSCPSARLAIIRRSPTFLSVILLFFSNFRIDPCVLSMDYDSNFEGYFLSISKPVFFTYWLWIFSRPITFGRCPGKQRHRRLDIFINAV